MMNEPVVVQCHKTKWKKNPVSGHEWQEIEFIKKWKVLGGKSLGQTFSTEKKAQEHADFLALLDD